FGLIPVLKYACPNVLGTLRSGGRSMSDSKNRQRARSALIVVQVALALVLLVSSGLMIRTFRALRRVDPGFSGGNQIQTLRIAIPQAQVPNVERAIAMQTEILRKIEALPGVVRASMTQALPFEGGSNDPVYVEGQTYREGSLPPIRRMKVVSPGYMATLGTRIIAGRDFTWSDFNKPPAARDRKLRTRSLARSAIRHRQAHPVRIQ